MLYVTVRNKNTGHTKDIPWHYEKGNPFVPKDHVTSYEEVTEVQADGGELRLILDTFVNLPHTKARVQQWFGDMAKYIVANLCK